MLGLVCITIPFFITYISNKKKYILPSSFELVIVVYIFSAQYLGEIKDFYEKLWWWDLLLHGFFGAYFVIVAFYLSKNIIKMNKDITAERFTLFIAAWSSSFSISLGTLWEIFEFSGDYFFKTSMVDGGLEDTSTDLIAKVIAALITSVIYYYKYIKDDKQFVQHK